MAIDITSFRRSVIRPDERAFGYSAENISNPLHFDENFNIVGGIPGYAQDYRGPVAGLTSEYVTLTSDKINFSATSNWFIHTGSGDDAIAVHGGRNVLDGGGGSNFLTGGSGQDTFFLDARLTKGVQRGGAIWSTLRNFGSGDDATVWGVTPRDFTINWDHPFSMPNWQNNPLATGGLTMHATAPLRAASLTIEGYRGADLTNGRLSVSFGQVEGNDYMNVRAA